MWIAFSLLLPSSLRAVHVHAWKAWVPRLLTSVYLLEIVLTLSVGRAVWLRVSEWCRKPGMAILLDYISEGSVSISMEF